MAVPVVLGRCSFDYKPLRDEQSRLARTLVVPSPRDKDDTSMVFEVTDNQTVPFKYPTFIKVFYNKNSDIPRFEMWMKDNFDVEHNLALGNVTTTNVNGGANSVPSNFVVSPVSGEIRQGGTLQPDGTINGGTIVGTIKFDGVTGLALAAINTRIADVSNSIEGITKILSVVSSNLDGVLNLIR